MRRSRTYYRHDVSDYMDKICDKLDKRCKEFSPEMFAPKGAEVKRKTEYLNGRPYEVFEWEAPIIGEGSV